MRINNINSNDFLNDPLTSGVVNEDDTAFMSSWNVTFAESAAVCALDTKLRDKNATKKVIVVISFFIFKNFWLVPFKNTNKILSVQITSTFLLLDLFAQKSIT